MKGAMRHTAPIGLQTGLSAGGRRLSPYVAFNLYGVLQCRYSRDRRPSRKARKFFDVQSSDIGTLQSIDGRRLGGLAEDTTQSTLRELGLGLHLVIHLLGSYLDLGFDYLPIDFLARCT